MKRAHGFISKLSNRICTTSMLLLCLPAGFDMWYGTPTISVESWPVTLSATKYMAYRFCGLEVTVMSTFACSIDSALHVGWILVTGDKSSTTETDWIRCSSRGLLLAQPFGIRTNVSAKLPNLAL
ncbi:hypothetical protein GOP47_0010974 [Adiantum capillus-veneris]|uniref:Uncharacterized protein n=1 Tax=Adiantum capillus-veneris TaxID=13818 RepID=A0A9D4UVZ2_ADICA|nr:hypothetical protein GOP47_0010974 [Adiantum capillus-veneris]